MSQTSELVSPALPDPVGDTTLRHMIDLARAANVGQCSEEGLLLLLQNMGPCFEELLDYRQRAAAALELQPSDFESNVIELRP